MLSDLRSPYYDSDVKTEEHFMDIHEGSAMTMTCEIRERERDRGALSLFLPTQSSLADDGRGGNSHLGVLSGARPVPQAAAAAAPLPPEVDGVAQHPQRVPPARLGRGVRRNGRWRRGWRVDRRD